MQSIADRPRATRYHMSAPVWFRCVGEQDWQLGQTVNVSRTGVLFTSGSPVLAAATRLEFVLVLPSLGHPGESRVQCEGQVVRQCRTASEGASATAATIDRYEFLGMTPASTAGLVDVNSN